jgi:hypothetical protein
MARLNHAAVVNMRGNRIRIGGKFGALRDKRLGDGLALLSFL